MAEGTRQIEMERHIKATPETIFSYFTDSVRYAKWMGVSATLDARPGGIYQVHTPQGYVALGEFVEVDPPKRVVFTWGWKGHPTIPPGSSRVEITLQTNADHTTLKLIHSGLPMEEMAIHTSGWERYLGRLTVTAEGGQAGPDEPQ